MNNETETIIFLRRSSRPASEEEGGSRTWSSRIKGLAGRLKGGPKEGEGQESYPGRSLEELIAMYAPDQQPDSEHKKAANLMQW